MALPKIDPIETEFEIPVKEGTVEVKKGKQGRGPDKGNRAPAGFRKAVEEIAQIIFSKTRISVEGAARSVVPSIPRLLQEIGEDIRTGSVEKFKVSIEKLENIVNKLGLDLGKYNKDLANFLKQRQENLIKSEERIYEIREKGAKAEINQITGQIDYLSREEIKQRRDTLKETLIELKVLEKEKNKQEKQLQESRFLSEEEIESKKKFVSMSYEAIKNLQTTKETLMKTLNIQSEEDLPSTGFFSGFGRGSRNRDRGGGEGIRGYVPSFIMDIGDAFTQQITGFFEPLRTLKDIFLDILKPLKIFKTLLGPIVTSMKGLLIQLGRQIKTGIALVAVNLMRILTDKKVLLALLGIGAFFGIKNAIQGTGTKNLNKRSDELDKQGKSIQAENIKQMGSESPEYIGSDGQKQLKFGEAQTIEQIDERRNFPFKTQGKDPSTIPGTYAYKMKELRSEDRTTRANIATNATVSNVQTQNSSAVTNLSTGDVSNSKNAWFNQVGSF